MCALLMCNVYRELNDNKLSSVLDDSSPVFIGLTSLSHLVLATNQIKSVSRHAFEGLDTLRHLDLTENDISSLQDKTFQHLSGLHAMLVSLVVCLSLSLSLCLSICLCGCLSAILCVCLCCLHVWPLVSHLVHTIKISNTLHTGDFWLLV